jgi:hypothetical protein
LTHTGLLMEGHSLPTALNFSGMSVKKTLLRFLAVYVIAFVLVYFVPEHIHRRNFDKALMTWLHEPTSQNEKMLRAEQRKNEIIKLADSAFIALVLVALGAGVYYGIRFVGRRSNDGTAN